jgi:hypothetical protein
LYINKILFQEYLLISALAYDQINQQIIIDDVIGYIRNYSEEELPL